MAQKRKKYVLDKRRKIVVGKFHILTEGNKIKSGSQPIRRDLCTAEEYFYKNTPSGKLKERTPEERQRFATDLHDKKLKELLEEKKENTSPAEPDRAKMIKWLFDEFLEYMKLNVDLGERDNNTYTGYQVAVKYYLKALGNHPIERRYFNDSKINTLTSSMRSAGCSERTVWNHCISIKSILKWGYRQFDENDNRFVEDLIDFRLPKKPKSQMTLYRTEEVLALENAILKDYREGFSDLQKKKKEGRPTSRLSRELLGVFLLYKAVFLIKNTGMREGETLYLPYSHIDLQRGEITIADVHYESRSRVNGKYVTKEGVWSPKGNKVYRTIDIKENKTLMEFLKWDFDNKSKKERFFLGNGNGVLFFADTAKLTRALKKYIDKIPEIGKVKPFHSLRGWAITYLLAQGFPVPKVQDMAGHEDIKTTIGYWNLMQNASGELIGQLGNANQATLKENELLNLKRYQ